MLPCRRLTFRCHSLHPSAPLLQEEFVNGSALRLECNCRGDLALRHRECVMKWVQVKGSNVCELCKAEIRNIPAPPPRPAEADLPQLDEAYFHGAFRMVAKLCGRWVAGFESQQINRWVFDGGSACSS